MPSAVEAQQIILATMSGALVVLFGAMYALFFALGMINRSKRQLAFAYAAYACFVAATFGLAWSLRLSGLWMSLVVVMLLGYLLAPHGIWHLCVATHQSEDGDEGERV